MSPTGLGLGMPGVEGPGPALSGSCFHQAGALSVHPPQHMGMLLSAAVIMGHRFPRASCPRHCMCACTTGALHVPHRTSHPSPSCGSEETDLKSWTHLLKVTPLVSVDAAPTSAFLKARVLNPQTHSGPRAGSRSQAHTPRTKAPGWMHGRCQVWRQRLDFCSQALGG